MAVGERRERRASGKLFMIFYIHNQLPNFRKYETYIRNERELHLEYSS